MPTFIRIIRMRMRQWGYTKPYTIYHATGMAGDYHLALEKTSQISGVFFWPV
jgi:hypothetical protein